MPTDKMQQFKNALTQATEEHDSPNSFGATELHQLYGAPSVQWQCRWFAVRFNTSDGAFEARQAHNKASGGRVVWTVDKQGVRPANHDRSVTCTQVPTPKRRAASHANA